MTTDHEVMKAALDRLSDQAGPLRTQSADVARRIRRRRTTRAAGSAVLCAAVAIAGVTLLLRPAAFTADPASGSGGRRIVSFHGVQVGVPAAWATNAQRCGAPTRDTVLTSDRVIFACAAPSTHFDVLNVMTYTDDERSASVTGAGQAVRKTTRMLSGHQTTVRQARLNDGRTAVTLVVPDLDAVLTATTNDPALARKIIASAHIAARDPAGCLDPLPRFQPRSPGPVASAMVADGFTRASICAYDDLRVATSATVGLVEARGMAAQLNSLKPGLQSLGPINKPGKQPRRQSCDQYRAAAARNGFVVRFTYPRGGLAEVVVRWDGCTDVGVTNGTTTGHVTRPLLGALTRLTGHSVAGTALEDFVPR